MNRRHIYDLCQKWGDWSNKIDVIGYPSVSSYYKSSQIRNTKKLDNQIVLRGPDKDVKDLNEKIKHLDGDSLALIRAHFKEGMSYSRIGDLLGRSKSWAQQKVNKAVNKLDNAAVYRR